MLEPAPSANIARHLSAMAAIQPERAALKVAQGRTRRGDIDYLTLSFRALDAEVDAWLQRLTNAGVRRGDRTLVMVRQGLPLIAAAFALFKLGAVPVIIDPGMGLKNFLACVEQSRPRALVGITLAQLISHVARRAFSSVSVRVVASGSLTSCMRPIGHAPGRDQIAACAVSPRDLAAILFTSGSTGKPKGVCYEHGMFEAQIRLIQRTYQIQPGEIDLPMLPIFALFNPALGMTTIVPEIDPRRPASVDPQKIVQAIQQENVTNSFGSPTLWRKIGDHCVTHKITLASLRRVLCAGAPVPTALWESSRSWMTSGRLHSPYGATEALPVSSVSSDEIAASRGGIGACVGRAVAETEVRIIGIVDAPIASITAAEKKAVGEIGEIIVHGPTVTQRYDGADAASAMAKISGVPASSLRADSSDPTISAEARAWHRMGDCGYVDAEGRLWFCGRKVERVETERETLYTEPCEQVFREHPGVTRCALVGLGPRGQQRPAIVIESSLRTSKDLIALAAALRARANGHAVTRMITRFYFHPRFPVDVRHNAKIHRLALARWAVKARPFDVEA